MKSEQDSVVQYLDKFLIKIPVQIWAGRKYHDRNWWGGGWGGVETFTPHFFSASYAPAWYITNLERLRFLLLERLIETWEIS